MSGTSRRPEIKRCGGRTEGYLATINVWRWHIRTSPSLDAYRQSDGHSQTEPTAVCLSGLLIYLKTRESGPAWVAMAAASICGCNSCKRDRSLQQSVRSASPTRLRLQTNGRQSRRCTSVEWRCNEDRCIIVIIVIIIIIITRRLRSVPGAAAWQTHRSFTARTRSGSRKAVVVVPLTCCCSVYFDLMDCTARMVYDLPLRIVIW